MECLRRRELALTETDNLKTVTLIPGFNQLDTQLVFLLIGLTWTNWSKFGTPLSEKNDRTTP